MKSRISIVIILITIVLLILFTVKGVEIGGIKILSVSELMAGDKELEQKIDELSRITAIDYPENTKKLEDTFKEYNTQRRKYEELVNVTNKNNKEVYETKQYDISYLWRVLGKYATTKKYPEDKGLVLSIEVKKSNIGNSIYDFNFRVEGEYTRISQFIVDIESDSDLYFRIYNFKMEAKANGSITIGTFTVKNINIDSSTIAR